MNTVKRLSDLTNENLEAGWNIEPREALQIAAQLYRTEIEQQKMLIQSDYNDFLDSQNAIQEKRNEIFEKAFACCEGYPSALEAIAIQLGFVANDKRAGMDIVSAIYNLKED